MKMYTSMILSTIILSSCSMKQNKPIQNSTEKSVIQSTTLTKDLTCNNLYDKIVAAQNLEILKNVISTAEDICVLKVVDSLFVACINPPISENHTLKAILNIAEISDGYLTESLSVNFFQLFSENPDLLAKTIANSPSSASLVDIVKMSLLQEYEMSDNGDVTCKLWNDHIDKVSMNTRYKKVLKDLLPCDK